MLNNIDTLHTIYVVSLTAAIIMFILTMVLFFLFDMRHVFGWIFGVSEKKEIRKMEANTAFTSQLNAKYNKQMKGKVFTDTGSLRRKQSPAELLGMTSAPPPQNTDTGGNTAFSQDSTETESLGRQGSFETAVLNLDQSENDTTVLKHDPQTQLQPNPNIQFMIVKQIMMIHTDEVIEG
jgi:hypothetical protein